MLEIQVYIENLELMQSNGRKDKLSISHERS